MKKIVLDIMSQSSSRDRLHDRLYSSAAIMLQSSAEYKKSNPSNTSSTSSSNNSMRYRSHLFLQSFVRFTLITNRRNLTSNNQLVSLISILLCLLATIMSAGHTYQAHVEASPELGDVISRVSQVTNNIQTSGARLVRKLNLTKSSGQINEWLMNQVAPAVATKIIDNVLQSPKSSTKYPKSIDSSSSDSAPKSSSIDTHALADKIVDKLADSIKKIKNNSASNEMNSLSGSEQKVAKGLSRKGKSLVSDSVHHAVQSLFSKDSRKFFGRAMEKSKSGLRSGGNSLHVLAKEPIYEQHHFVSTDSNQLDENPVVLRAEHGHNVTTAPPPHQPLYQSQNLSPLISNLMSNSATNQIGNKLLQKHMQYNQKYVHTNRHQQQYLSPKPWPTQNAHNRRHQQQSPYSLAVTSDMNIVQAPSSPAPPPMPITSSTTTSTTSTTTTTPNPVPVPPFSFVPSNQSPVTVTQLGANKFKINNRHQYPSSSMSMSSSSWHSSNRNPYHHNNNHRFQHHHPSTTSTTTTTTTTTTTPEPPQTESTLTDTMESLMDLDQQTSSPVSSILSSVAQSALESMSQEAGSMPSHSSVDDSTPYNSFTNSSYGSSSNSPSAPTTTVKGASPSTTTARHSIISAEAIPTALGAPLYHLTRANFTATSIMSPPPRRSGSSPAAKVAAQYFQKGLNSLSSTIFGRQSKNWARRLGLSSVLLSGLLYGAAILSNPGAPIPTTGLEVLQALTKNKRRRGSRDNLLPAVGDTNRLALPMTRPLNHAALLDNYNINNILHQEPQLIPILEHLIQQEQNSLFSQRSFASPIEIESFDTDQPSRSVSPSQIYTIQSMPRIGSALDMNNIGNGDQVASTVRGRRRRR